MIDFTKYEGHTLEWKSICMYGANGTWGYFPICAGDRHLLADAPIIIEALKAAQARISELEKELTQPMLVNISRLVDANADLKAKLAEMGTQIKPREYTDDELLDMSR